MEVTLALLADAANLSQEGKLNVLGAFTNINASGFPARHPSMQMVLELDASVSEAGQTRPIAVRLLDPDGRILGEAKGEMRIPQPVAGSGQRVHFGLVIPLTDVIFQGPGSHSFDLMIGEESRRHVPLTITHIEEATNDTGNAG
jgi:hypothetical protein